MKGATRFPWHRLGPQPAAALFFLLGLLCLVAAAAGQQAPPPQRETPLRATARLVVVDVVVTDRNGHAVADLTRDDFTVIEDRQPQHISVFSLNRAALVEGPAEPLPPLAYSNRAPSGRTPNSVTIILVDALNTQFEDQAFAREQILKFLRQMRGQDRVALYALSTNLTVLHDFTSDPRQLLATMEGYRGRESRELAPTLPGNPNVVEGLEDDGGPRAGPQTLEDFLAEAARVQSNFQTDARVRRTLWALEAIANHVAHVPGRKNLVWVSSGIPFAFGQEDLPGPLQISPERRQYFREIERASRAVNNANLAIYPVDARGLIGAMRSPTANAMGNVSPLPRPEYGGAIGPVQGVMTTLADVGPTHDTMRTLAANTGGRAFLNTNDLSGAILAAVEDTRVTYTLGYVPTHGRWDGRFRQIRVEVNRPGVQVRHRRGYYALPDASMERADRQAALREAAQSPLTAASLAVRVQLIPGAAPPPPPPQVARIDSPEWALRRAARPNPPPDADYWHLLVSVDPREMLFNPGRERTLATLDVYVAQVLPDSRAIVSWNEIMDMVLSPATFQKLMEEGLEFGRPVALEPEAYELVVVVRDANSGATGSVRVPLGEVRAAAVATPR